jgi:hypothetical protein
VKYAGKVIAESKKSFASIHDALEDEAQHSPQ